MEGQPVLIDFEKSIISRDAFVTRGGWSYLVRDERNNSFADKVLRLAFGTDQVARKCCSEFLRHVKNANQHPRILVIGGGARGSGMDQLYQDTSIDLVGTDVYVSENTKVIADGHQLPFIDGSFDGVWIQAVLEHVLDPPIVVAEFFRVLKPGGLVFSDTPFMQQVHERAYDFTRFTLSGHRWLFKDFSTVDVGISAGAGTAFRWSARHLIRSVTGSGKVATVCALYLFRTRFLDHIGPRRLYAEAASAVYFLGRKELKPICPRDMVSFYEQYSLDPRNI